MERPKLAKEDLEVLPQPEIAERVYEVAMSMMKDAIELHSIITDYRATENPDPILLMGLQLILIKHGVHDVDVAKPLISTATILGSKEQHERYFRIVAEEQAAFQDKIRNKKDAEKKPRPSDGEVH